MLRGGIFPRVGAYAVLALGFWLLFQAFERSNILSGIAGGALIVVGMYLMAGLWKNMFAKYGGNYKIYKESDRIDDTAEDRNGGTGDSVDGSDEGSQLPP